MRSRMVTFLAVLALVAVFMLPAAHANIVLNGSFEDLNNTYIDGGSGFMTVKFDGAQVIPDWTVTANSVDWIGTFWPASHGDHSLDMTGTNNNGTIASTLIATTVGSWYKVTFDLSGNFTDDTSANRNLQVSAGGESANYVVKLADYPGWSEVAGVVVDMDWASKDFYFQADAALTKLEFSAVDGTDNRRGPALDNVQVNAVPIPGALVLLGAGLVRLVGYSRRKRALA